MAASVSNGIADLADDEQRDAVELDQFILQPPGVVGLDEASDPSGLLPETSE